MRLAAARPGATNLVLNGVSLGPMTLTPEPATLALLAAGALGVLVRQRRPWAGTSSPSTP